MSLSSVRILLAAILLASLGLVRAVRAEDEPANYDEAQAPAYTLPDPLVMQDGRRVTTAAMWHRERRPELLTLFATQEYGRPLPEPRRIQFRVTESVPPSLVGKGVRRQVRVELFGRRGAVPAFNITVILPSNRSRRVPVFVGMHLFDTAASDPQPGRPLDVHVGESLPGAKLLDLILARGYAIATLDAKDFCPDDKERFRDGVLSWFYPGRTGPPGPEEPGAIATWAWALRRAVDYFECAPDIDARRVAVIGHSRMGKTALWAGAQDPRFALVISNNSGCAGAALSRRIYGETVGRIERVFPHWFCGNFAKYAEHESQLPVDQHELIALIAPRPVYIASAEDDRWADPRGEFLAAVAADPVYRLLGKAGLQTAEMPPVATPIGQTIGYHIRPGKHVLSDYDWMRYLDFADRCFRPTSVACRGR